jgi:hypothetical protein
MQWNKYKKYLHALVTLVSVVTIYLLDILNVFGTYRTYLHCVVPLLGNTAPQTSGLPPVGRVDQPHGVWIMVLLLRQAGSS